LVHGFDMNLQGPDEVIAGVPYLLGFHPTDSLVLIWIVDGSIAMTQRMDLAGLPGAHDNFDVLLAPGLRIGASHLIGLIYAASDPAELSGLAQVHEHGIDLVDVLRVHQGRWWSLLCDQECCPPEGRLVDPSVADQISARFVFEGQVAYAARSDLVDELQPDPVLVERAVRALRQFPVQSPTALLTLCLRQWGRVQRQQERRLRARVFAAHLTALRDVPTRDRLGWHLAQLDRGPLLATCWLLRTVLRAAPTGEVAPIGTMAGIAHWLAGDGARASVCLERALADDPDYVLAQLIARSVQVGLPPSEWRALLQSLPAPALSA